ncbi:MAG: type III-A CRISPR-associated protein Csm2 [Candidatus Eremiobacterota bacterium]
MKETHILNLEIELQDNTKKTVRDIIPDIISGNVEKMISAAIVIGNYIGHELPKKERLYPYQIRKIFGTIKRIEIDDFDRKKLLLLKPQLVFIAAKNDSNMGIQYLKDVLIEAIDQVGESEIYFRHFCDFFEAILAYHQAAEKEF